MSPMIQIQGVEKLYRMRGEDVHALRGVDLSVQQGEYISIMGPSGSGKTTLFNMIGGLDRPTAGSITVSGIRLAELDSRSLAWFRCCHIGYVFQTFNLIDTLTALDNVKLPCVFRMLSDSEAETRAKEMLHLVGLRDRMGHRPQELSGGQMQRVAIARSLVNDPEIVLADEPTGNLDLKTGESIIELLGRLNAERGVTVVTVTHDHKMLKASDRVVWFESGRIEKIQRGEELDVHLGHIQPSE